MSLTHLKYLCCAIACLGAAAARATEFPANARDVLERRCLSCHKGPEPKGGLSLETAASALEGGDGGPTIVPGRPDASPLIEYISGPDPEMPKNADPLKPDQIAALRSWIEQGATWPEDVRLADRRFDGDGWWSFEPLWSGPVPPAPPEWARGPIDRFVFAKMREKGLSPSPEADKRTLIRRVTFNLHGLPPAPEDVDAFLADTDPLAYERLVDRLLASPRYGERWARHWLDVVHYGDTHGFDKDKRREHAWRYRDYVIESLNRDIPYDQFVREQIAGDVLFPDEPRARIATGFLAAGPWDFVGHVELREGTVDKEITRVLDRDDMVASTLSTFCGVTVHCARCHDHPFDPIRQEEYYRLQAVFAGVDRGDVPFEDGDRARARRALAERRTALERERDQIQARLASLSSPRLLESRARTNDLTWRLAELADPLLGTGAASPSNGYHGQIEAHPRATQWVQIDLGEVLPVDRVDLIPARPTDFPDTPGFGFPIRFEVTLAADSDGREAIRIADHRAEDFPNPRGRPVRLRAEGQPARFVRVSARHLWPRTGDFVFALAEVIVESGGRNVALGKEIRALNSIEAGRWSTRFLVDGFDSRSGLPDLSEPTVAALLDAREALAAEIESERRFDVRERESLVDPADRGRLDQIAAELNQMNWDAADLPDPEKVYAVVSLATPRPIHRLERGDVRAPREPVAAGAIQCVRGIDPDFQLSDPQREGERRAALARWITAGHNVLTWRAIVNRVWHFHFDRGLCDTPNDLGHLGSRPTHPELLDWLAKEFLANGQSLKWLHRQIVTSATYRQSSAQRSDAARIDGGNQFLWRMNRRRLDAESTRDAILATSGYLDLAMGGPGFPLFGFQDDHSPRYKYEEHDVDDPGARRRAIYRFIVRSVPDPWMERLDCADPSLRVPVRDETITALQALALLNHPFLIRQSEHFARRLEARGDALDERIGWGFRLAFARDASPEERALLIAHARRHGLPSACRLLFNASEFVFVD